MKNQGESWYCVVSHVLERGQYTWCATLCTNDGAGAEQEMWRMACKDNVTTVLVYRYFVGSRQIYLHDIVGQRLTENVEAYLSYANQCAEIAYKKSITEGAFAPNWSVVLVTFQHWHQFPTPWEKVSNMNQVRRM